MEAPLHRRKAEFFKTLGHPARIRILELLAERDHAVHELLEQIDIGPSNLSQQLAVLRRHALVVSHRQGNEVLYSLGMPEVARLLEVARSIVEHPDAADALVPEVENTRHTGPSTPTSETRLTPPPRN
ncbi:ArsR/SmtB family transcription factor [Nocardioides ochotonae]|uniref:ArsR/SmtB family transcription factor n=1 Tax=Nocardioides ochotonae TaxID=2685869 RepID=UPI0014086C38|nr:metalloregulator ArsR/SmtB family transcription factor [Nocardioides ochotonae]